MHALAARSLEYAKLKLPRATEEIIIDEEERGGRLFLVCIAGLGELAVYSGKTSCWRVRII